MADLEVPRSLALAVAVADLAKEWVMVQVDSRGIFLTAPDRDFTRPALALPWRAADGPLPLTTEYRVRWGRIRDLTGYSSQRSLFAAYSVHQEGYPSLLRNSLLAHIEPRAVKASFSSTMPLLTIKGVNGQEVVLDCQALLGRVRDFNGAEYQFGREEYLDLQPAIVGICEGGLARLSYHEDEEDEDDF